MNDVPPPEDPAAAMPEPDASRAQLSAYLAGELDDAAAAALEARLAVEPGLAGELDRLADLLVALQDPEQVEPPRGFRARLDQRLAAERQPSAPALARHGVAAAGPPAARPRGAVRPAVKARRRLRPAVAGVAVVALLAFGGGAVVLQTLGTGGQDARGPVAVQEEGADRQFEALDGDDAMASGESAADEEAPAAAAAGQADTVQGDAGGDDAGGDDAADTAEMAAAPPPGPALADSQVPLADDTAVRAHFAGHPAVAALRGRPAAEAPGLAAAYRDAITAAGPFDSGADPAACLDGLLAGTADVIPAVVETVQRDGATLLAYVLVRPATPEGEIDTVEVWLLDATTCDVRAVVS